MSLGEFIPSSSTKLCLHLNGNSTDSSSSGNSGTDTAITYSQANGKFGQGAGFNGSSSKINIPYSSGLSPTSAITISAWVKITTLVSNGKIVCRAYRGDGTWNTPYIGYALSQVDTSNSYFNLNYSIGTTLYATDSAKGLSTGIWYNVIATFNGTNSYIYINGNLSGSSSNSGSITYGSNASVTLGDRSDTNGGERFNGAIDEVIIENRAWSASEVKKYYTASRGRFGII